MKRRFLLVIICINIFNMIFSQWITINHEGILRTYYLSVSSKATIDNPSPLIINLHGYGGIYQIKLQHLVQLLEISC